MTGAGTGIARPFWQGHNMAAPTSFKSGPPMAIGSSAPATRYRLASTYVAAREPRGSGTLQLKYSCQKDHSKVTASFTLGGCTRKGTLATAPSLVKA